MYQNTDWVKAITKLSRLTSEGSIQWRPYAEAVRNLPHPDDRVDHAYSARHGDKEYIIYKLIIREYNAENDEMFNDLGFYLNIYKFGLLGDLTFLARSPRLPAARDLYRAVEKKFAFEANALGDLLDDEG
jgi:hypothetical protein